MITSRKSKDRGYADHGWLKARHTFSFADYYDPKHMEFGVLRVINEDRIAAGMGFPTHGHRDMEIVTIIIDGALEHKDSMGNTSVIRPGEVQRMSAGTGVRHSEFNASQVSAVSADAVAMSGETHLLQIWIQPSRMGIKPSYEQKSFIEVFEQKSKSGKSSVEESLLVLVVSPTGREGSLSINQDAEIYMFQGLAIGSKNNLELNSKKNHDELIFTQKYFVKNNRKVWIQMIAGRMTINKLPLANDMKAADGPGVVLDAGDGAAISDEQTLSLEWSSDSKFILFDMV
jgi:redox-sensitive bicupin YhaK (pirin superfamily)